MKTTLYIYDWWYFVETDVLCTLIESHTNLSEHPTNINVKYCQKSNVFRQNTNKMGWMENIFTTWMRQKTNYTYIGKESGLTLQHKKQTIGAIQILNTTRNIMWSRGVSTSCSRRNIYRIDNMSTIMSDDWVSIKPGEIVKSTHVYGILSPDSEF